MSILFTLYDYDHDRHNNYLGIKQVETNGDIIGIVYYTTRIILIWGLLFEIKLLFQYHRVVRIQNLLVF